MNVDKDVKLQEYKFIEWSNEVSIKDFDISNMIEQIQITSNGRAIRVADIGGGIGSVASVLATNIENCQVDVIDNFQLAKQHFLFHPRTNLIFKDFFVADLPADYDFVIFRTVLHHFVGLDEADTTHLQTRALGKAHDLLKT